MKKASSQKQTCVERSEVGKSPKGIIISHTYLLLGLLLPEAMDELPT